MAKKKIKSSVNKDIKMSEKQKCGCGCGSGLIAILATLIIILVWGKPDVLWSQITITIAAALIVLSKSQASNTCKC